MVERVQRKRTKGWRMPHNTVYVGRGTAWGNPFKVGIWGTAEECIQAYRKYMSNEITPELTEWRNSLYDDSRFDRSYGPYWGFTLISAGQISELRGKNLACWCKPGEPCHADVLIELANKGGNDDR